ncbi:MAG: thymidine phosphorylase [Clostridiales bacterium]|nr:thymidine phosphorylase [Clostridiales bacterium]
MRIYDIIYKKRMGKELSREEIEFFINGYVKGEIPDYQASALCMAICFCGMNDEETSALTYAMMRSGDVIDLSAFGDLSVDKHSTGGVGDKTSLIVGPIVASLGGKLAKMSGRGLGHTGGTVDKLESIPGYRTTLSPDEFMGMVENVGMSIIGQSGDLAPADKKLYALRDVTATVDCIPLIASSIMSKKLAAGAHSIVLDVKTGSGAFMKTVEDSRLLAEKMVAIGTSCGRNVRALVTNMDVPLGRYVGNSLEVMEAVHVLRDGQRDDLYQVCRALASNIVSMFKKIELSEAEKLVDTALSSGAAYAKMKEWIGAQGGDVSVLDDLDKLPIGKYTLDIVSDRDGYISHMDTEGVGICASLLGAGRISKEDKIDFGAGIVIFAKTSDKVSKGEKLATLYASDEKLFDAAKKKYLESVSFSDTPVEKPVLIY